MNRIEYYMQIDKTRRSYSFVNLIFNFFVICNNTTCLPLKKTTTQINPDKERYKIRKA